MDKQTEIRESFKALAWGIDSGTYGSGYPICMGCGVVKYGDDKRSATQHVVIRGRRCPVVVLREALGLSLVESNDVPEGRP